MEKFKKIIIKYSISLVIGAALVLLFLDLNGFYLAETMLEKYKLIADAFTIPGVIFIMVGALVWVSTTGFFDILSYALGRAARSLIPGGAAKEAESFHDYKARKVDARFSGYAFILYTGLLFLVVSIIFTILFFCA